MTPEIQEIINAQGWDDQSVLQLLWSYVEAQGQDDAVLDHFIRAKMEEDSHEEDPQLVLLQASKPSENAE